MANTIYVQSKYKYAADGSGPIALHEYDHRHPGGEVWIADGNIHEVAPTGKVNEAIAAGALVQVHMAQPPAQKRGRKPAPVVEEQPADTDGDDEAEGGDDEKSE